MEEDGMSRTKGNADQAYALMAITCPDGHNLGKVLKQPGLPFRTVNGTGWQSPDPLSSPLAMTCHACESRGVNRDLRGSWEKIKTILAEVESDPTRGKLRYVLGG